jgi:hypothetical protein
MQKIFIPAAVLLWGIAWIGLRPWESKRTLGQTSVALSQQVLTPPLIGEEFFHPNEIHKAALHQLLSEARIDNRRERTDSAKRESKALRDKWEQTIHQMGFHEQAIDPETILARPDAKDLPGDLVARLRSGGSQGTIAAPDPATIVVPFSAAAVDCPLLKNGELKTPALISIDTSGLVTGAVPVLLGAAMPDVSSCHFRPYPDSNGYPEAVTVSYAPPKTPASETTARNSGAAGAAGSSGASHASPTTISFPPGSPPPGVSVSSGKG